MDEQEILAEFRSAEALLEGHFVLSSGLHSPLYLQCARVLMDPARAARLAHALASRLPLEIRVLLVEDVVTTGSSSREAIAAVAAAGGEVVAAASLIDRSNGLADLGVPFFPLIRLDIPLYEAGAMPPEFQALPVEKPGSRKAA